jgi:hypothetical protein
MEKWTKDEQPVIDKRTGEQGISVKLAINACKFEPSNEQRPAQTAPIVNHDEMPF